MVSRSLLQPHTTGPTTHAAFQSALDALSLIIVDKTEQLRLALCCLISGGHLLIEDVPGVGKTTMAHALAQVLGLTYQRIQFTSDMLPADILGVSIFDRNSSKFEFHRGPVFSQVVLADEINRATPKAQSALLEAMEERQVTADGSTYTLPSPFFVIATSNPASQIGTFDLPESQLDRFLMKISLGYPGAKAERALLSHGERRDSLRVTESALSSDQLVDAQQKVGQVFLSEALLDYVQAIIAFTRDSGVFTAGLSPRAGIALVRAAQASAFIAGRDGVHPEDVQCVLGSIVSHRLVPVSQDTSNDVGAFILRSVPIS